MITPPLTINETQEGLLKKEYSVVDLVDAYLDRIDKYDKEINSFLTLAKDSAYNSAKNADDLLRDYGKDADWCT